MLKKAFIIVVALVATSVSHANEFREITAFSFDQNSVEPTKRSITPIEEHIDRAIKYITTKSSLGFGIVHKILGCDAKEIKFHLGTSEAVSAEIAEACSKLAYRGHPYIGRAPKSKIKRLKVLGKEIPRKYVVATSSEASNFDSWTDALTNTTTLVLDPGTINFTHLVQQLAHEMGIYFDPKGWVNSYGWNKVPGLKEHIELRSRTEQLKMLHALSNPLVSHVLSYIRAFKVERDIVTELHYEGLVSLESGAYSSTNHPYLSSLTCDQQCVFDYISNSAQRNRSLSLPLLSLSPGYRFGIQWREQTGLYRGVLITQEDQDKVDYIVGEAKSEYFNFFKGKNALEIMEAFASGSTSKFANKVDLELVNETLADLLLTEDIKELQKFVNKSEPVFKNRTLQNFIQFLTEPVLMGENIKLSSGPRPRVSGGGG